MLLHSDRGTVPDLLDIKRSFYIRESEFQTVGDLKIACLTPAGWEKGRLNVKSFMD